MDGRFPNHHPDPTVSDNMRDLVRAVTESGAELGIAFDGDADRIGVVDARGRIVWGDELLVIFGRDVLARNPGATIVSEVKCSQRLYDDLSRHGGHAIMWKAGHSLLKAKMRETGALLGGEMSGHIFFKERYFGYDDAIYAGARLLEIVARTGKTVDQLLADLPPAHTLPGCAQVQGGGACPRPFPGGGMRSDRRGRRARALPAGLGAAARFEHATRPGDALRGRDPRAARGIPAHRRAGGRGRPEGARRVTRDGRPRKRRRRLAPSGG